MWHKVFIMLCYDDLLGRAVAPLSKIDPGIPTDLPIVGEDGGISYFPFKFVPRYTNTVRKPGKKVSDLASKGTGGGFKVDASVSSTVDLALLVKLAKPCLVIK